MYAQRKQRVRPRMLRTSEGAAIFMTGPSHKLQIIVQLNHRLSKCVYPKLFHIPAIINSRSDHRHPVLLILLLPPIPSGTCCPSRSPFIRRWTRFRSQEKKMARKTQCEYKVSGILDHSSPVDAAAAAAGRAPREGRQHEVVVAMVVKCSERWKTLIQFMRRPDGAYNSDAH